jgi:hypothetical protein
MQGHLTGGMGVMNFITMRGREIKGLQLGQRIPASTRFNIPSGISLPLVAREAGIRDSMYYCWAI